MSERLFLLSKKHFFAFCLIFALSLFLPNSNNLFALTEAEQEAQWRAELVTIEADIAKWQSILDNTKADTASLQQEAAVLNAKIKQAKALIKQKNVAIEKLNKEIGNKEANITALEARIEKGHESLAQLLRKTNEIDEFSLPEIMLGNEDISEFFSDIDSFQSIKESLKELFIEIRETKNLTEKEKAALDVKKDTELDTKAAVEAQKAEVEKNEKEKQYLIQVNKTQEKTYEQVLAERRTKASEIKAKLFKLAGNSEAIPFETALIYAKSASKETGVTPAFLLAILTQESNLGANVGQCNIANTAKWNSIMPGPTEYQTYLKNGKKCTNSNLPCSSRDDQTPFKEIVSNLGISTENVPLSCPIKSAGPWGGAMGPAQFIPSTWKIFEDELKDKLGHDANPWNAQDAFMASALYLQDLGAGSGTYSSEIKSACKYYGSGGTSCSYGKSVMKLKASIQEDIDYLNQYGTTQ